MMLMLDRWNAGLLLRQWWSYAGDDDRRDSSQMGAQYFLNYQLTDTWLAGMAPSIRVDWKAKSGDEVTFPIGIGVNNTRFLGPLPIRWGVELQYFPVRPDPAGLEWNFRIALTPVVPRPF